MQLIDGVLVLSPSDLVAFTGCEHRTHLDRAVARGELERERRDDPFVDVLRKHGILHERRHLDKLRATGARVVELGRPAAGLAGLRAAEAETLAAMRAGVDVIYQATFFDGRWRGHADFLCRVEEPSALGSWSYEAHDTKLARSTKAGTLLQLGDYSRQLARLQQRSPRRLHVVLGDDTVEPFLFSDIAAYLHTVRARFEAAVDAGLVDTSPDPVALCASCDWKERCTAQWRTEDHLSLVAGLRRDQRTRLAAAGVGTRAALAELPMAAEVSQVRGPVLASLREQTALQIRSDHLRSPAWALIEPDSDAPHRGLASLPQPSPGDLFFDMEGDQFVGHSGREYLFGWVEGDAPQAAFRCLWAHDPAAEKASFEEFIDTVMAVRRGDPAMHVYHYAPYEPSAMKKLMGRYTTREAEVDELLRGGVFVDLYRITTQSVRVGVGSYSIKKLEPLYSGARGGRITDAGTSIVEYEAWLEAPSEEILESIRAYNEDDCRSLVGLRGWLEERRAEFERSTGSVLPRPPLRDGAPPEGVAEGSEATERLAAELTAGIPIDGAAQTREQRGRALLAALLDWHRRDSKPAWWEYFAHLDASDDELIDDPGCLGGLEFQGEVGTDKRSRLYQFRFPAQECKLGVDDDVEDPRTVEDAQGRWRARPVGVIHHLDTTSGVVVLKRGRLAEPMPTALIPGGPIGTRVLREALARIGEWVRDHGIDSPGELRAIRDLVLGNPPRIRGATPGAPLRADGEDVLAAARRLVRDADATCIAVQGPPGSGKTFTAATCIVDLVTATPRRRVAVTSLSHRAISHLLRQVCDEARRRGTAVTIVQKSDERGCDDDQVRCVDSNGDVLAALDDGSADIVAGTSWLFARPEMAGRVDTLFVDEAGQLSLANVAAMGGCARTIVLLGDPQQLEQPSQGSHPAGAGASALGHVLGGAETVRPEQGLFLDVSWRMHPAVCTYISANFYESRLTSAPRCAVQAVGGDDDLAGTGLRWLPVEHTGNRTASAQEAVAVGRLVRRLLGRGWVDEHGVERPLTPHDVLVVAPYNAHVAALRLHVHLDVAVGSVDRFQGQEAAVVIYSMATSLAEDVPRGIEFLLSRHRMNVAISRARCLAVLVCAPNLLRVSCTSAAQIPLANALCDYVERALVLDAGVPQAAPAEPVHA